MFGHTVLQVDAACDRRMLLMTLDTVHSAKLTLWDITILCDLQVSGTDLMCLAMFYAAFIVLVDIIWELRTYCSLSMVSPGCWTTAGNDRACWVFHYPELVWPCRLGSAGCPACYVKADWAFCSPLYRLPLLQRVHLYSHNALVVGRWYPCTLGCKCKRLIYRNEWVHHLYLFIHLFICVFLVFDHKCYRFIYFLIEWINLSQPPN